MTPCAIKFAARKFPVGSSLNIYHGPNILLYLKFNTGIYLVTVKAGNFMTGNFLAHLVTLGDFIAGNFLARFFFFGGYQYGRCSLKRVISDQAETQDC